MLIQYFSLFAFLHYSNPNKMHRPDPSTKPAGKLPVNEEKERSYPCQGKITEKGKKNVKIKFTSQSEPV